MELSLALKNDLYTQDNYRDFLRKVLSDHAEVKGYKSLLANEAGCQPAYFSQVMSEKAELTPEHAEKLCSFWNLDEFASDYFFHLVLLGRAGTISLKKRLDKKLSSIRKDWKEHQATFGKKAAPEKSAAMIYYAHWLRSAIHLLLTVPGMQNETSLAKHLQISEKEVLKVLQKLESVGLVEKTSLGYRPLQIHLHAAEENFFAEVHHKNWRTQALEVRAETRKPTVRYTSVHSLSKDDFKKIQLMIEEFIQKSRATIESSPEEMGACLLVDYFGI